MTVHMDNPVLGAALDYCAKGWSPIRVKLGEKAPPGRKWQDVRITTESARSYFTTPSNIGVLMGEPSDGLVDLDLDAAEAIAVADHLAPSTGAVFGRAAKPRSHRLYVSDLWQSADVAAIQFKDPTRSGDTAMILELRCGGGGKGCQTIFPPSTNPSGEAVAWVSRGDPGHVPATDLRRAGAEIAAAALLRRHWPGKGDMHTAQLALSGWLTRNGWPEDRVAAFLSAVADEPQKRRQTAKDSAGAAEEGDKTYGRPTLAKIVGEAVVSVVAGWLALTGTENTGAKGGGAWPEPDMSLLDRDRRPAPPFPAELFGPWSDWIAAAAETKNAPPDYVAVALLTVAGSLIGNNRWAAPWQGWREPPVLWGAVVGDPSAGKSPALDAVLNPLAEVEGELTRGFAAEHEIWQERADVAEVAECAWRERVKKAIKAGDTAPPKPEEAQVEAAPIRPRLAISDATVEMMAEIIAGQWRGALQHRDELAGWLGNLDKYGGAGDRPFWLEAYGGRPYRQERKKNPIPIMVDHLSVGVLGGIQPDRVSSLMLRGDDDGLLARFIVVWPEPAPLKRPSCRLDEITPAKAFSRLLKLEPSYNEFGEPRPYLVRFDEPACERLQALRAACREREGSTEAMMKSHIGKMPGLAVRLAVVLLYLDWAIGNDSASPGVVGKAEMDRACRLIEDYLAPMAERTYGDAGAPSAERGARRIATIIREDGLAEIGSREIQRQRLAGLKEQKEIAAALALLIEAGWLRIERAPTKGRTRTVYAVNPAVLAA